VLNLSQTWNNGTTTFTGALLNVTNTNSGASSNLVDLQVGTVSQFSVGYNGTAPAINLKGNTGTVYNMAGNSGNLVFYYSGSQSNGVLGIDFGNNQVQVKSTLVFGNGTPGPAFGGDVLLTRKGAANLRFGAADAAAPAAQTLSVQSIVGGLSGTPNLSAATYPFKITGAQGTGTGAGGSIIFQVAPAGGSGFAQNTLVDALTISSTQISAVFPFFVQALGGGNPLFQVSNLNSSGGYSTGVDIFSPNMAAGDIQTTLRFGRTLSTYNSGNIWFSYAGSGSTSNAIRLNFQGGPEWFFTAGGLFQFLGATSSFPALKRSSTTLQARLADDSAFASVQGKLTTDTAYTAATVTLTGYITIYDSTGTAYKVPVGTVSV
jgi:hypothetical protein